MRYPIVAFLLALGLIATRGDAADAVATTETLTITLDPNLVSFVKWGLYVAGGFLVLYALIGVVFFGFDVTKARMALTDADKEVRQKMEDLRKQIAAFEKLRKRLEVLGAKLEEHETPLSTTATVAQEAQPASDTQPQDKRRSNLELIRQVIRSSNFEWTTIGRLIRSTGLNRDQILEHCRSDPDIQIGFSDQTKDHLFKFRKTQEPPEDPE